MSWGTFSGRDVVKVMVNSGIYEWVRTNGDHAILRWEPPAGHDTDARTVPVPLHDELDTGTLRSIAEQAGARDFEAFQGWIERNR
jgi:predicted RNA binding protein YcfA (HicA-like mRNA interferase family)